MAGSRPTELHHGGSQDMGEPNHHRKRSPRSESDSEDELDFDRIGFEEFKREWAASLRRMPSDSDSDSSGRCTFEIEKISERFPFFNSIDESD